MEALIVSSFLFPGRMERNGQNQKFPVQKMGRNIFLAVNTEMISHSIHLAIFDLMDYFLEIIIKFKQNIQFIEVGST